MADFEFKIGELNEWNALHFNKLNDKEVYLAQRWRKTSGPGSPPGPTGDNNSYYDHDINLPAFITHNNISYKVTQLGTDEHPAFYRANELKNVSLPYSLVKVCDETFMWSSIMQVNLNDGLQYIGQHAFYIAYNLREIEIPDSVTYLGRAAFATCTSLSKVTIGAGISVMCEAFFSCKSIRIVTCRAINPPAMTEDTFEDVVYQNATLYVPYNSVEKYKANSIWKKFRKIRPLEYDFECKGLFYKIIGNSKVSIVKVEERKLSRYMFSSQRTNDGKVKYLFRLPSSVLNHDYVYNKDTLTTVQTPSVKYRVEGIDINAFHDAFIEEELPVYELILPNSVKRIGSDAFKGCIGLTITTLKAETIGDNAFEGLDRISHLFFSDSVKTIGRQAFANCKKLQTVYLCAGVTSMDGTFKGCDALKTIVCRAITPPKITNDTFSDNAYMACFVYVPSSSYKAYKEDPVWKNFKNLRSLSYDFFSKFYVKLTSNQTVGISGKSGLHEYKLSGNVVVPTQLKYWHKDYTVNAIEDNGFHSNDITSVKLPLTIKSIGFCSFRNCKKLTKLVIPNSVQTIKSNAFESAGLTEINIPDSVETIENEAFSYCRDLERITIGKGLKTLSKGVFGATKIKQIVIPDTITGIEAVAFGGCENLSGITIPDNVVSIGESAFYNCNSMTSISLGKQVKEIGKEAFKKCTAVNTVYCYAKTPPKIGSDTFDDVIYQKATLIVPAKSISAYKTDDNWRKFNKVAGVITDDEPEVPEPTKVGPIRYILLKNNSTSSVHIRIKNGSESYDFDQDILNGHEQTVDLADAVGIIKEGDEVWLEAIVKNGKNATANQHFVYQKESKMKACYAINGNTLNNALTYVGLKEHTITPTLPKEEHWNFEIDGIRYWVKDAVSKVVYVTNKDKGKYEGKLAIPSIVVSEGVTYQVKKVGNYAFKNCPNLTEVTLPESIVEVKEYVFHGCTKLALISCNPITPPKVMEKTFTKTLTQNATLSVPQNHLAEYMRADGWKSFKSVKGH